MLAALRPEIERIPHLKFSFNIGALLDIPTGKYETGIYGESILNGGLGNITGVVGIGNNFKSTSAHYMLLMVLARMFESTASTYDTEVNISENRLKTIAKNIIELGQEDVIENERWQITDKTKYHGNEWFEIIKQFMDNKVKAGKDLLRVTPFLDRDGKTLMKMIIPTVTEIDSFTKFDTEKSNSLQEDNQLGSSDANTLYMKEGADKKRLLNQLPKPAQSSANYFILTAHIGKTIAMDPRAAPVKKLQFLKNGDTLKGVTEDFTFLTTNCWNCQHAAPLVNDTTKGPEYPRDSSDNMKGDTDLFTVNLLNLRSKVGPTGMIVQLVVSQQEGVLPSLTEFHYLKTNKFGFDGNNINYNLFLLPEVKLSRTAIRGKIDNDAKLRRALNITAELCQMTYLWHEDQYINLMCTPQELYEDIKKLGYDWDMLLSKTRGWWTYDNDKHPLLFLSTLDLLKMRLGQYHPYWLSEDKKTIKKEFIVEKK